MNSQHRHDISDAGWTLLEQHLPGQSVCQKYCIILGCRPNLVHYAVVCVLLSSIRVDTI